MPEYRSPGVYVEEIGTVLRPIGRAGSAIAGFVGMTRHVVDGPFDNHSLLDRAVVITSWAEFVKKYGAHHEGEAPYLPAAVHGFFENGGQRCYVVRVREAAADSDYIGVAEGSRTTGLQALREVDEIDLVCIPGVASLAVQRAMIDLCEDMGDRLCILDAAKDADPRAVRDQRAGVASAKGYAALYYPWIKVSIDKGEGAPVLSFVPPSGHVAGVYARVDGQRGMHKAPANEVVNGALEVRPSITKSDSEMLNTLGINCIRPMPGRGIRVWGARTTANDPEWKYVHVRRLFIFIKKSIDRGTGWIAFEANNEKLWARVTSVITEFLTRLWQDGALMGTKAGQAFFVRCDRTTMTEKDISDGRLICLVGIAPVRPAEFIVFRIQKKTL